MTLRLSIELAADAMMVKSDNLAWLHIADILSTKNLECTSLAGYHVTVTKLSESERMEAILVAASIDTTACHYNKGERTIKLVESILDCIDTREILVNALLLDKMSKNLSIGRRLEKASLVFKLSTKLVIINYLTVVCQSEIA
jgi:hypothetical protein